MLDVEVYIIENNSLFREGLKSTLTLAGYNKSQCFSKLESVKYSSISNNISQKRLTILGEDNKKGCIQSDILQLHSLVSDSHLVSDSYMVILSETFDADEMTAAFSTGVDGYMLKTISRDAFLTSLELVLMGEKVFPTSMANVLSGYYYNWHVEQPHLSGEDYNLSEREIDIIKCLVKGESNKVIAKHLSITEATVKVHLKAILRKLSLSNRTQAAIWAVSVGLVSELPQQRHGMKDVISNLTLAENVQQHAA